jgi:hypothetical protein
MGESRGRHNQRSPQATLHPRTTKPTNKNPTVPTPPLTRKQKGGIATKGRGVMTHQSTLNKPT